ncbi:hypothetical protein OESDEN_16687 [Oesophagostomum dentatum]|uniref:Uncharacterized protein n=1 Tax=Oesophagostomum dentatum TaxID=61180 RepID=A0A0B1SJD9_OESDE|nr:hypothetical protein OESDEN_16687 [Oesophagostomum dentatum]
MYTAFLVLLAASTSLALMCYEGTLNGLEDNSRRTEEKYCSPMSHYCVQKIDRRNKQIRRECSSFSDEHNMIEKCPVSFASSYSFQLEFLKTTKAKFIFF